MNEPETPCWHVIPVDEILKAVDSSDQGITAAEAARRIESLGANVIPSRPPANAILVFLRQFKSPVIYILLAAAIVSLIIQHATDAAFIGGVVVFNALIGGFQEHRAERSARALQGLLRIRATVLREGEACEIDASGLAPGDVVLLESGDRVPADIRLLATHSIEIDESLLTGESIFVEKRADWIGRETAPLADRANMAYAGSMVTHGRARGVVVATGATTHVGQLAVDVMGETTGEVPLLIRLARFTRVIGAIAVLSALLVAAIGIFVSHYDPTDMFIFAVALAVAAIPEGLPVSITVALAVAARRMARRGVIIRRLGAVEGLGSCTLIASDKTGTLTCNQLTVQLIQLSDGDVLQVTGQGFVPNGEVLRDNSKIERGEDPSVDAIVRAAVLCNEADLHPRDVSWAWRGDPTDVALLSMGAKIGWRREATLEQLPQINQISFEPELRFAATFHRSDSGNIVCVKGAPERVLEMCEFDDADESRQRALRRAEAMAEQGYRVLAFADGAAPAELDETSVPMQPVALRFLGFVGMIDPLRPGVIEAIRSCHIAGVGVSMVTGDHPITALSIARELGLADTQEQVMTGDVLAEMSDSQLARAVNRTRVFARVAPHQKLKIVQAAQQASHFVAVTGDGVNDAPALRAANIGVAMGKGGTDVAREASDMVISDDNLSTIVAGIEEGRVAFDNIRKVIYLLLSSGIAEVGVVILSVASGLPLPLLPAQLLWLNLVTNGIQDVALAFESGEGDVLQRKPRPPRERIFNRVMIINVTYDGFVMTLLGFGLYWWLLREGYSVDAARNVLLLQMVLFENVHLGNCRSETKSPFYRSPLKSPVLLLGAIGAFGVHLGSMYLPIGQVVLRTEPVSIATWLLVGAVAVAFFLIVAAQKWVWRVKWRMMENSGAPPSSTG